MTEAHQTDFMRQKFKRKEEGKFTLIFPFSKMTEELAIDINKKGGGGSQIGPNLMKQLVSEVKIYYDDKINYLKNQKKH